jgi:inner membrane protein
MSSGRVHQFAAFAAGCAMAAHAQSQGRQPMLGVLLSGSWCALATKLPDLLEPAEHPNHRQFFHSATFGLFVGKLCYEAYRWIPANDRERIWRELILLGGGAYLLHLVLDLGTPKGIPLLGKF